MEDGKSKEKKRKKKRKKSEGDETTDWYDDLGLNLGPQFEQKEKPPQGPMGAIALASAISANGALASLDLSQ